MGTKMMIRLSQLLSDRPNPKNDNKEPEYEG
jgi:hypothetical protein